VRVLVIGNSGQLAHALADATRFDDIEVATIGRPQIDLALPDTIEPVIVDAKPDAVVNAAAYTAVDQAEDDKETAHALNSIGPAHIARICARLDIPFVHVSTDYVFDGEKGSPYTEADETRPIGVYGRSKLEGERSVAQHCPRHAILRTSWLFSPHGNNFVKTMLRLARSRLEIGVVDDQIGNPTYAPHLADVILDLSRTLSRNPSYAVGHGVFNAAGTGHVTWCGLAREVFAASARSGGPIATVRPIITSEYPTRAARPRDSRLDGGKLARVHGLRLPDWQSGVADCVAKLVAGQSF
jgi:dTDP-4-dehydrorhamnose reductase